MRKPYERRFPKAIRWLETGLEDSLSYGEFLHLDARKISFATMMEQLNREIRCCTHVVGMYPNPDDYIRLATVYLMEYAEDWSVSKMYLSEKSLQNLLRHAA